MSAEHFDGNSEYLAASLDWLRLRLRMLARPESGSPASDEATPTPGPSLVVAGPILAATPPAASFSAARRWFRARTTSTPAVAAAVVHPIITTAETATAFPEAARPSTRDPANDLEQALAVAAARREATASIEPRPALITLAERLGLSAFERDVVLLCAAAELDPTSESLFASVQGGNARSFPTFALALRVLGEPTWDALSPHRPLRYSRLLEINQPGATPLTAAALRVDERILNFMKGINALDDRVAALVTPTDEPASPGEDGQNLSLSQHEGLGAIFEQLRMAAGVRTLPCLQLLGADVGSKVALANEVCAHLNRRLYRVSLEALPTAKGEFKTFARLWHRESALLPVALYVDAENLDTASPELVSAFHALIVADLGLFFVALREAPVGAAASRGYAVDVDKPTPVEQRDAWAGVLKSVGPGEGEQADLLATTLAGQFDLNLPDIRQAAALAVPSGRDDAPLAERIWDACRRLTHPRLDALAQRLTPKATWKDLVLSDESAGLLRQIAGQVRGRFRVYEDWGYARRTTRGLGISALFTGESGVGKTMAAEVIANELRLHLYRIDLSAVVSKYIGETEKNLRRLFDAAEQGGAILFFDEADALFGKRSEIKDSHDRYANIEINYLLQRMESFSGLAILATNMKGALDQAFMRRLRFVVNFQFPGRAERRRIWEKALPPEVPREGIDYEQLARFNLSGGNIHSVALNAAFLAAERATPVTAPLLMSAVRSELRKLDKPINEAEFR